MRWVVAAVVKMGVSGDCTARSGGQTDGQSDRCLGLEGSTGERSGGGPNVWELLVRGFDVQSIADE